MKFPMRDWKAIAAATNLGIPEDKLDALVPTLATIEKAFRPLAREIPVETDPAFVFSPVRDECPEEEK